MDRKELIQNIDWLRGATSIEALTAGYSRYPKFHVVHGKMNYVLRLADGTQFDRQRELAEVVRKMADAGLPVAPYLAVGRLSDRWCYSIRPYIKGNDAKTELVTADDAAAYRLGVEAGRVLAALHRTAAPASVADWAERC